MCLMNKKCRDEKDTPSQTFLSARSQNNKRLKKREGKIDPFSRFFLCILGVMAGGGGHKIWPQKHMKIC